MFVYQEMAQLNHTTILSSSFQFLSLLVMKIQPGQASHIHGPLHRNFMRQNPWYLSLLIKPQFEHINVKIKHYFIIKNETVR